MIFPVVSSLIYSMKRRIVIELYSPSLRNLWKEWDARVMVVLSLTLQILLSILGNRRKSSRKLAIRIFVWFGYISADSVATFALGILASNATDMYDKHKNAVDANIELAAFWAPFLLLHLGGPDSITAYGLEDNELWTRQGIGLIVQTGMAFYVFLSGWTGSRLSVLSLVMFFPGLVKYGERVWMLRSASDKLRRTSMARENYFYSEEIFSEEFYTKQESGYATGVDRLVEIQLPVDLSGWNNNKYSMTDEDVLLVAYGLLDITNSLFVNSTLNYKERDTCHTFFRNISSEDAFRVIEIELGLRYDLLYTKTLLIFKPWRFCLRVFTFFLTTLVLILFTVFVHKDKHSKVDLSITFILLIVSFLLEIYAALVLLSSDWFLVWLTKKHYKTSNLMKALISSSLISLSKTPRWSNKMSQFSLLNFTNKAKPHLYSCNKLLNMLESIHKHFNSQYWDSDIPEDLRRLIFQFFKQKAEEARTEEVPSELFHSGGGSIKDIPGVSIREEFEYNIMVWHIATEVCYYLDREINPVNCKSIKQISRYLMYLLVEHPSMLSVGTGQINFQEISGKIESVISDKCADDVTRKNQVCDTLLKHFTSNTALNDNKKDHSTEWFLVRTAFKQVEEMNKTYPSKPSDADEKWQRIGSKWFEMLVQAANNCRGNEHAQQLRRGGEFLTHVWLLMGYFGLTDHSVKSREPRPIARLFTE